ncbi:roundabout homolog 1-like [Lytechinus variegatus]|uniref:roundabout homolog 1-like n=1 Tax=Lytechinus variegatus TaxID=7654 RepID=UPI001BB18BBF|nr:roundabout homolog 1-like [Lytechinus variegatus]
MYLPRETNINTYFIMFVENFSYGYNSLSKAMASKRKSNYYWIYNCLFMILLAVGADSRRNEESPPRITEHPSSLSVRKNSPATLNCRAEGFPIPDLRWLKDGQELDTKGDGHVSDLGTGALFFFRVIPRVDIGVYQCVATNSLGVAYSNNATLDIACKFWWFLFISDDAYFGQFLRNLLS